MHLAFLGLVQMPIGMYSDPWRYLACVGRLFKLLEADDSHRNLDDWLIIVLMILSKIWTLCFAPVEEKRSALADVNEGLTVVLWVPFAGVTCWAALNVITGSKRIDI